MKRLSIIAAVMAALLCGGCFSLPEAEPAPDAVEMQRSDGTPLPVPAWTNVPEVYHGQ